jgi:hypothetical protein
MEIVMLRKQVNHKFVEHQKLKGALKKLIPRIV